MFEDRLTDVGLDSGDMVEYVYDGIGRRIERIFTTTIDDNPDITTYKYHYIGSQITDIDIDATNDGEAYKDEELLFHLGANSQPISLTWKKYNYGTEQTTSATYYYHFDVHGNTLNLTNSSGTVKATYAYDTLGKMTYYDNDDSIPNPFTYGGATQVLDDSQDGSESGTGLELYFGGAFYNPDTGTMLQGTGAPASSNPSSGQVIAGMGESTNPAGQQMGGALVSATTGGSSGGGNPGNFSPPSDPSEGIGNCGEQDTGSTGFVASAGGFFVTPPADGPESPLANGSNSSKSLSNSPRNDANQQVATNYNANEKKDDVIKMPPVTQDGGFNLTGIALMEGDGEKEKDPTLPRIPEDHLPIHNFPIISPGEDNDGGKGLGDLLPNDWFPDKQKGELNVDMSGKLSEDGVNSSDYQHYPSVLIKDNLGNVLAKTDKNGNLVIYDWEGNPITDASGRKERWDVIVHKGEIKATFWDRNGKETDGMIAMKMDDGTWSAITGSMKGTESFTQITDIQIGYKASPGIMVIQTRILKYGRNGKMNWDVEIVNEIGGYGGGENTSSKPLGYHYSYEGKRKLKGPPYSWWDFSVP